jgi:hypothetical protein
MLPASPILSGLAGKCADDPGGATANGSRVTIGSCDGSAGKQFTLGPDATIRIAGQCLDVTGSSADDGTPVQLQDCDGAASEDFRVTAFGMLHNPASGKCLADPGDSATNGTQLVIEDCYGLPGEVWALS